MAHVESSDISIHEIRLMHDRIHSVSIVNHLISIFNFKSYTLTTHDIAQVSYNDKLWNVTLKHIQTSACSTKDMTALACKLNINTHTSFQTLQCNLM